MVTPVAAGTGSDTDATQRQVDSVNLLPPPPPPHLAVVKPRPSCPSQVGRAYPKGTKNIRGEQETISPLFLFFWQEGQPFFFYSSTRT